MVGGTMLPKNDPYFVSPSEECYVVTALDLFYQFRYRPKATVMDSIIETILSTISAQWVQQFLCFPIY